MTPAARFSLTQRQIVVLAMLLIIGSAFAALRWGYHRSLIPDPQPEIGERAHELADQIDLETADWSTLAVLPGIGPAKARDILAKRDELHLRNPGSRAFNKPEDLYMVKGIAAATVDKIRPFLLFPESPATHPSR
jgi:hypothetical protein